MFETATISYGSPAKRMWATFAGFTGQAILIASAVLAPMLWPQAIPKVAWVTSMAPPGPPPPPRAEPPVHVEPRVRTARPHQFVFEAPARIPTQIALIVDEPRETAREPGVPGAVPGGGGNADLSGIFDQFRIAVVRPPEPPTKLPDPPVVAKPPRVTQIEMAAPIHRVGPIYPPIARQMRVSGAVELMGVLGTDGRIHELKVLRGHPLLVKAAVDAVMQWTYRPTILNGRPVEVSAPITVNFILN